MKVLMIANDTNFAWNLRREVLIELVSKGWETSLLAQTLGFKQEFEEKGVNLVDLSINRRGKNPIQDIKLFWGYYRTIKKLKPDIVLINNTKPNMFAGIACQLLRVKYISNVTGLGTAVEIPGKLQRLSIFLYKRGVRKAEVLLFQNSENRDFFSEHKMTPSKTKSILLPGSGVNIQTHPILPWPEGEIHFLYAARIMKEKGIDDYLAAAQKFSGKGIVFDICGQCDDPKYTELLKGSDSVVYHGLQKNLLPFYGRCSCFIYPSFYPEGMSNVCLEAASCGRPVIVADRSGCRETVDNGKSGYIIPIKNQGKLFEAIESFLELNDDQRREMGLAGRRKMEREFDRRKVVEIYIQEIIRLCEMQN